jgi:hypothetical protein
MLGAATQNTKRRSNMLDNEQAIMALYIDLLPEEENTLKAIEDNALRVLYDHGVFARPVWTSRTGTNGRIIMLCLPAGSQPTVVFELPSSELATLSHDELSSRLNKSMEQHLQT